jgi:hypothetical protein
VSRIAELRRKRDARMALEGGERVWESNGAGDAPAEASEAPRRMGRPPGFALTEEQKQAMRDGKERARLAREAQESEGSSAVTGLTRELYLDGPDTAEELGISPAVLIKTAKLLKVGRCKHVNCRYTVPEIERIRAFRALIDESGIPQALVVKLFDRPTAVRVQKLIKQIHDATAPTAQQS